jgi:arylsulfatase A-like enzyme/GT2 family glycosyltransferase
MTTGPDLQHTLTVLICTHNRVDLLSRVIASLNAATRPTGWRVRLFVVANACTDGTHAYLDDYPRHGQPLPLCWIAEPTPGKSHALNRALPMLEDELVAFVDDDHRVDASYLAEVAAAAERWPEAGLICGRIVPDWDGSEPRWVHDEGPYRIYPLPVPRYDQDKETFEIGPEGPIPGGGNLAVRLPTIAATGPFATELGPTGHDLGGSEDADWILRALQTGARLRYAPGMLQYHYVDNERLQLGYIARKGYQRSRSVTRVRSEHDAVPRYMWRKVATYGFRLVFSLQSQVRRFYLVRLASALGEVAGIRDEALRRRRRARLPLLAQDVAGWSVLAFGILALAAAALVGSPWLVDALLGALVLAGALTGLLLAKSIRDFSRTGPKLREEIVGRYRSYVIYALIRLAAATLVIGVFWGFPGGMLWLAAIKAAELGWPSMSSMVGASLTLFLATVYAACRALSLNPGLVIASWSYRTARVHRLWRRLSPRGLNLIARALVATGLAIVLVLALMRARQGALAEANALVLATVGYLSLIVFAIREPEAVSRTRPRTSRPNLLMIGSDTLRADRIGAIRDGTSLTPNIDLLASMGTRFTNCYVPCARTAPSLISMLTGTWPHHHGVRDNFAADAEKKLHCPTLPKVLRQLGYRNAAVSDWCGADLGKFDFGFDILDLPEDQWNLKYLIRQGPKDIRLFLSLFLHNRVGRLLLPEIYYLGGVPQTSQLGRRGRHIVSRLASAGEPFFLNLFYSTTHPPFASEYPYYVRYADADYKGESKFAMARLTEPFEIIRRQGEPREEFDLDQILALYDGCVAQFDEEVGRLIRHVEACGLLQDTLIVLYSDHGMEFFEHGTWGQGNSALGDFSARVPLVLAGPNVVTGQCVDQVVRTVDLMPTLLDLLAAPSIKCDGTSLKPSMIDPGQDLRLSAFNETGIWVTSIPGLPDGHLSYPDLLQLLDVPDDMTGTLSIKEEFRQPTLRAKDRMVREGKWKLVYQPLENGMRLALYDVEIDPGCTENIADRHAEVVARLYPALKNWMHGDVQFSGVAHSA